MVDLLYTNAHHFWFAVIVDKISYAFGFVVVPAVRNALLSEIFPTSHRATAMGILGAAGTIASFFFLTLEPSLFAHFGNHYDAIPIVSAFSLLTPLLLLGLPETAGKRLDDVAPERER